MYVNIRRSVDCVSFEEVEQGQLFVSDGDAYIRLKDCGAYSKIYNAVNLETGEPKCFEATDPVVIPDVVELTVDL